MRADLPWDEEERLAALLGYGILDTPPEPDFDNIARVASLTCKAPIAVVNLIADQRQWFKSEIGLGIRETPLDVSFCARAILRPGLLVVPDASKDPQFACNPLVSGEPHLRFYAGARLDTPEGLPLGTVCVLDFEPRPDGLTEEQTEILLALARQAMAHLELRRAAEARDLLGRELSHRIKNVFAIVSGLASISARGNAAARPFVEDFRKRVSALAQANEYVLPQAAAALRGEQSVHGLLRLLIAPYQTAGRERFFLEGDDARLGPTAATALAMIVHEQATNAVKYGALSVEAGTVRIRGERDDDVFRLIWDEEGGPAIAAKPERTGFGTLLATRTASGQLGGTIDHDWRPGGLRMRLTAPLGALLR